MIKEEVAAGKVGVTVDGGEERTVCKEVQRCKAKMVTAGTFRVHVSHIKSL